MKNNDEIHKIQRSLSQVSSPVKYSIWIRTDPDSVHSTCTSTWILTDMSTVKTNFGSALSRIALSLNRQKRMYSKKIPRHCPVLWNINKKNTAKSTTTQLINQISRNPGINYVEFYNVHHANLQKKGIGKKYTFTLLVLKKIQN